jgi:dephospho-CoA kinase
MLKVGLTGGIASGKSTVCEVFNRLGAMVLDADTVAREVVLPGRSAWTKLRQTLGSEFFCPDGNLNRRRLRKLIFSDPIKRRQVNAIVHPEVMREINRKYQHLSAVAPDMVFLVDVPLLLEVGAAGRFDRVLVVYAAEDVQIDRLMRRDGLSRREANQALGVQTPLREKVKLADFVIDNNGTLKETQAQVEKVWRELLALAQNQRRGDTGTRRHGDTETRGRGEKRDN